MFELLSNLFDMISEFFLNIGTFFSNILIWGQQLIGFVESAADVFLGTAVFFPAYISVPVIFIITLSLVLRVWSIITSGGGGG